MFQVAANSVRLCGIRTFIIRAQKRRKISIEQPVMEVARQPACQIVELEQARHEIHLIQADSREPKHELVQRAERKVTATVQISLSWHVGVVHHASVFRTACQALAKPREIDHNP